MFSLLNVRKAMNSPTKLCAYCMSPDPETRDHVPPQSFFPKPRPSNLITVPCCEKCRKEQSIDDEYFRLAVVSSSNVSERESAKKVLESIHRSLHKPGKLGFSRLVNESLFETEVHTDGGIYLGRVGGIDIKKERIDRVSERIIRGLFYHEFEFPLPENYEVTNQFSQTGFADVAKIMKGVKLPEQRKIGEVFWYTFAMTKEDPFSGVWLQVYYEGLQFLGFTIKQR